MGDTRRRVVEEAFVDSGCAWEWVSQFYRSCPIFQVRLYLKAEKSDKIPFEAGNSRCPSYGLGSTCFSAGSQEPRPPSAPSPSVILCRRVKHVYAPL